MYLSRQDVEDKWLAQINMAEATFRKLDGITDITEASIVNTEIMLHIELAKEIRQLYWQAD
jgi:hypothetical protein